MNEFGDSIVNPSANRTFDDVLLSRRNLIKGGLGAWAMSMVGTVAALNASSNDKSAFSFASVPVSTQDRVVVPPGYEVDLVIAWGDPINGTSPTFKTDASNTAAEQALQAGMHHDGMHFFAERDRSDRGVLVMNHEYADDGLLHTQGMRVWTAEQVAKSQAAHGVSVLSIERVQGRWTITPSPYMRRITASTPIRISGPASAHALMRTAADPRGTTALGTFNNCANGHTPWGTYLACEENFNGYFVNASLSIPKDQARYGITKDGFGYRWHEHDARFDAREHPNEPNRFGWVVEIDPFNPASPPVKRTALGRFKHEGATVTLARDGRVVVYMGDDERNEYIYKFVSARPFDARDPNANRDLLDDGTLYVARFEADGDGQWRALTFGRDGLVPEAGFNDQAEVLIKARLAADVLGATKMDRPEWIAVHPQSREVYVSLTNNSQRGTRSAVDAANPRENNVFGHIVRWNEANNDPAALTFSWNVFILGGNPMQADASKRGTIRGDAFGSPDGLSFDSAGTLWIQTDVSTTTLDKGDYAGLGNNQMLAADTKTGETRRFLVGPRGCEITGVTWTPDRTAMFINVQHPGETPNERSDPAHPTAISDWPHVQFPRSPAGRPRSATVVIRRGDGGPING
ncbi:MAG TPA: PhoX family phosphatase [Burkholderiaceae bacterium]|nr:PhoX family phosphatase [Burkholderiaceae bacterium]